MKPTQKTNKLSSASRRKLLILSVSGITLVVSALCCALVDPVLLIARHHVRVAPGSSMYSMLSDEIVGAYISAYFFNVTNAQQFLSGQERRLKVEEVGPFTYQERRHNTHLEVDYAAKVLRYRPYLNATFVPELSIADPADINVTVPNIAFLAIATAMSSYPYWSQMGMNLLTRRFNSKAIVTMSVHDNLWGYDEPLLAFGHSLMPGWITFKRMGLLDRLYDNSADYRLELSLEDSTRFQVRRVNGHAGLPIWGYEDPSKRSRCNSFEDTYEGFGYPLGLTPDRPLRLYRNMFCRMLELDYVETQKMDYGPEGYLYKLSNRTYSMGPDKQCLCGRVGCRDGMSDLSPCLFGLPVMMSNAHFYGAEPREHERVAGLAPDERRHGGAFLIEPKLGSALATSMTFQLNVPVADVSFNEEVSPFSNITVPIAYFKVTQPEVDDHVKTLFWMLYVMGPYAVFAAVAAMSVAGLCLLAQAARLLDWSWLTASAALRVPRTPGALQCEAPLMNDKTRGPI